MSIALQLPIQEQAAMLRFLGRLWLHDLDAALRDDLLHSLAVPWQALGGALPTEPLDALQADFCQLLANPKTFVAPFQSVWTIGQLDGPSAQSMRVFLRESGYSEENPTDEVADHFGLQLDLAGWMLSQAVSCEAGSDVVKEVAEQFIAAHVRWGLTMLSRVEVAAETEFYRALGTVTRQFVEVL